MRRRYDISNSPPHGGARCPMQNLSDRTVALRDASDWSQHHGLTAEAPSVLTDTAELVEQLPRWWRASPSLGEGPESALGLEA